MEQTPQSSTYFRDLVIFCRLLQYEGYLTAAQAAELMDEISSREGMGYDWPTMEPDVDQTEGYETRVYEFVETLECGGLIDEAEADDLLDDIIPLPEDDH